MKTITRQQYLQLLGLFVLVKQHNAALRDIEQATAALLGVPGTDNYFGHISDQIWNDEPSVDTLLLRLDIQVQEA